VEGEWWERSVDGGDGQKIWSESPADVGGGDGGCLGCLAGLGC
jgi:hypothetical protein